MKFVNDETRIKVLYKDYDPKGGEPILNIRNYTSWDEIGNYTIFYDDISEDSAKFIIPTNNVCWIEITE